MCKSSYSPDEFNDEEMHIVFFCDENEELKAVEFSTTLLKVLRWHFEVLPRTSFKFFLSSTGSFISVFFLFPILLFVLSINFFSFEILTVS
ncbi:unnamed protein product [Blepharisma stoltei]|uniref:Uncharacterized protein n=1 Tax=Blepharisma stoltei TaxID=1481888 RepID=A0AAU9IJ65_9CILI|nr:unnamed protein product [Blepharisma stoltei]